MAKRGGTMTNVRARGEQTRRDLVDAGRALFVSKGYFNTSIGDLVTNPGRYPWCVLSPLQGQGRVVSRGVRRGRARPHAAVARLTPARSRCVGAVSGGLHGFLESALEPEVQRVMLLDGPVVLGWQTLRSIEERNSIALINEMAAKRSPTASSMISPSAS